MTSRRRVVVLGGYGNFGSRLVTELAADDELRPGLELVVAGRDAHKAGRLAREVGADHAICDVCDPSSLATALAGAFLVIHAAGPFQGRGAQQHAVARAALDAGAHMLDLSDGREHVLSLAGFDAEAKRRGLLLAGGASTVPAISDALVSALAPEFAGLESVEVGLAPGNRNPRGVATVTSVLTYAGRPVRVFEDGHWTTHLGWGRPFERVFPPPVGRRRLHLCDVPDLELFPPRWGAPTVRFGAGLELGLLDGGLQWLAERRPRQAARFGKLAWAASLGTRWFGSAAGAVAVWVRGVGVDGGAHARALALVTDRDGPAAPCAPALLLARRLLRHGLDGGRDGGFGGNLDDGSGGKRGAEREAVPDLTAGAGPAVGLLTLGQLMEHLGPRGFVRWEGDERGWLPPGARARCVVSTGAPAVTARPAPDEPPSGTGATSGSATPGAPAAHWDLDPDVVFLNHGSFGACPRVVLQEQSRLRARLEREPVHFMLRELEPLADAARTRLAQAVGADPDDLAFVTNATQGVNTVLRSLEWQAGDEIVITDHGYNACNNAARFVAERAGARVVTARLPFPVADAEALSAPILAAVTRRTRLVLLDHVTSPTGLVLPVGEIVAALAARGVDALVDGAHAPGMLPLALSALGAAYYTANAHKWLCAPKGVGFLHVRRDRQAGIRPLSISHGANAPRRDRSRFRLEFDWTGTDDPTPALCLPAALDFLEGVVPGGLDGVMAGNHALVLQARDALCTALGVARPAPDGLLGSLAAVPLPARAEGGAPDPLGFDPLQEALFTRHRIEVPVTRWGRPEDGPPRRALRVSAQLYNAPGQYARLAQALREELARGGTGG